MLGEHQIHVLILNVPVNGSPFLCEVGDPNFVKVKNMPNKIKKNALNLEHFFESKILFIYFFYFKNFS